MTVEEAWGTAIHFAMIPGWGSVCRAVLKRIGRGTLDFLYPPLCIGCRVQVAEPGSLCAICWQGIEFLDGPACTCCGLPFELDPGSDAHCAACLASPPSFDRARAVMRYDEDSRGPILALKHADRLDLVPGFARWLDRAGRGLLDETDVIVPVPLHPSAALATPLQPGGRNSRVQSGNWPVNQSNPRPCDVSARRPVRARCPRRRPGAATCAVAFEVPARCKSFIEDRRILLIDDVLTTGATADACARVLKRAGAEKVNVLALARVVRPSTVHI